MGRKRPSIGEQRLARVRAIKDEFFNEEPTIDELLHMRDERIAELEREIEILRAQLHQRRSEAESHAPKAPTRNRSRD